VGSIYQHWREVGIPQFHGDPTLFDAFLPHSTLPYYVVDRLHDTVYHDLEIS
jgi:hypothetical protein